MANLVIMTAGELRALDSLERQAARRATREQPLTQRILRTFLEHGGPVAVESFVATLPPTLAEAAHDGLAELDDQDLIRIRAGQIDIAYPFTALPTPFRVRLSGGRDRYACCATDSLGIAPMVGERIGIESSCHHCGAPLTFSATPHGVGPDAAEVMLWFGRRGDGGCKAFDSL
jgi:hypothetical protein